MKRQASSWVGPPNLKPPLTTIPSHLPSIQDFIGEVKNIIVAPCDNLTLDSGRLMGYSGIMKTFTVIGRVWTRGHGYLATRCQMDFEAKNKTRAINMARELRNVGKNFVSCNNFVAFDADCPEDNPLALTPAEREHERDYWAQEARISDDPEIMPH